MGGGGGGGRNEEEEKEGGEGREGGGYRNDSGIERDDALDASHDVIEVAAVGQPQHLRRRPAGEGLGDRQRKPRAEARKEDVAKGRTPRGKLGGHDGDDELGNHKGLAVAVLAVDAACRGDVLWVSDGDSGWWRWWWRDG